MINGISGIGSPYYNGLDNMIKQSDENVDRVLALFESAIMQGYNPEAVEAEVYRQAGVDPADFTFYDKQRISKKVNEIWESNHLRRY